MEIAVVLNAHGNTDLVLDTLASIKRWVTNKVVVVVDGKAWPTWGKDVDLGVPKIEGFLHGVPSSPYRNYTLGLMTAVRTWPQVDWYCYTEYDVLFGSDAFKMDLEFAKQNNVWCLGNAMRKDRYNLPLLNYIVGGKVKEYYYLLGCCVFHNSVFMKKLNDANFFERFLFFTNEFRNGYFPGYSERRGYDFGEHLYPTLACHYGGLLGGFAEWDSRKSTWTGNYSKFPMRWQPDLDPERENFADAAILHPIKSLDNPLRKLHKMKRDANGIRPQPHACNLSLPPRRRQPELSASSPAPDRKCPFAGDR